MDTKKKVKDWFTVDKEGLRSIYAHLPPYQGIFDLIQNSWDTDAKVCKLTITQAKDHTLVVTEDDHPDGFADLKDAYTMFKSESGKRADVSKRGRFSSGEKIVLARAIDATITSTTGTVTFNATGRSQSDDRTAVGTVVRIRFPRWTDAEYKQALDMLSFVYTPAEIRYELNGKCMPYHIPVRKLKTNLTTEVCKNIRGQSIMTRTRRNTEIWVYGKQHDAAYLYELGIPVCEIAGVYDVNIQQKVPLGQERNVVPQAYIQDIYAEMLAQMPDLIDPETLGAAHVRTALEDTRVTPEAAARIFRLQYGDKAVIQSHDIDSDQEAARDGATIVNSRTFGSDVNAKLREGGVKTTKEVYCRNRDMLEAELGLPSGFREVSSNPARNNLTAYVKMLGLSLQNSDLSVKYASWHASTLAFYRKSGEITFNVLNLPKKDLAQPVSRLTATILHELGHAKGNAHDSVYDHAFEALVDKHTYLLATQPEKYIQFEPELFVNKMEVA